MVGSSLTSRLAAVVVMVDIRWFFVIFLLSCVHTQKLPTALIIGVKKAGTRALLDYLRLHPKIVAPGPEIHYFDRYFERGINWYRNQMPVSDADQWTIEKTPSYFIRRQVPARVFAFNPNMKLLLIVRNPVQRAISDYTQSSINGETIIGDTFDLLAIDNKTGNVRSHWSPIRIGIYANHLRRWLRYFSRSHLHIIDGDRLSSIDSTIDELRKVETFLGIAHSIDADRISLTNSNDGRFPCIRQHKRWKCLNRMHKGRKHVYVSNATLAILDRFYRPYNEQFDRLVGHNFSSLWY